ncbi:MAG: DUF1015 domain-containing protein [Oscillospiraceae bacterium]|nr:DUF1015 domain-containing protein [Oscillospiraceae bacterium]
MAVVRPFRAVRPTPELVDKVAALPYDVMNSQEAREYVKGNPYSFMRIDRAEINLPEDTDMYSQLVYETAASRLNDMKKQGVYQKDAKPCYYVYRQIMDGRAQTGIVACASVDDYQNNVVKKHELTLAKKEDDRCNHVDFCDANTGPIFLTYKADPTVNAVVEKTVAKAPVYDFDNAGVRQTCWVIDDDADIAAIQGAFAKMNALYIADGHHRCASAVRVARKRRVQNPGYTGEEEFNFFLCVLFPDEQLAIMDYNRVVADLNGNSEAEFLAKVAEKFEVEQLSAAPHVTEKHTFGMYLGGRWWKLTAKPGTFDAGDVVAQLDVSILQQNLLTPILGIGDPRTDKRIDFVGGIRGLGELEKRVKGGMAVAFAMCPTSIEDLMSIADSGRIMPPKSTWFEPKLLSGIFIHELK